MASKRKVQILSEVIDSLQKSENFALVKFDKTTHLSLEKLRRELKKENAALGVVKNTLFEKAAHRLSEKRLEFKTFLEKALPIKESTAMIALEKEWNGALKAFSNFSEKDASLSFKVGILDGMVYTGSELNRIAKLPSRPELIAKILSGMKSPIAKLPYAMKFNMQKIVYILNEKSKQTAP